MTHRQQITRLVQLARAEWTSAHRAKLIYVPALHGTDEQRIRQQREATARYWLNAARNLKHSRSRI